MENAPHWNRPPHPDAQKVAARFDATIRRLIRLTGHLPEDDSRVVNLRRVAGTLGRRVLTTQGASFLVQQNHAHSSALALQSLAQHPTSDSLMISTINYPGWGELRPSREVTQLECPAI